MPLLKYLLLSTGVAMFVIAAGILTHDTYVLVAGPRRRLDFGPEAGTPGLAPGFRRMPAGAPRLRW
jgi:hypothetical protein